VSTDEHRQPEVPSVTDIERDAWLAAQAAKAAKRKAAMGTGADTETIEDEEL
jgi:hypothetical protein